MVGERLCLNHLFDHRGHHDSAGTHGSPRSLAVEPASTRPTGNRCRIKAVETSIPLPGRSAALSSNACSHGLDSPLRIARLSVWGAGECQNCSVTAGVAKSMAVTKIASGPNSSQGCGSACHTTSIGTVTSMQLSQKRSAGPLCMFPHSIAPTIGATRAPTSWSMAAH